MSKSTQVGKNNSLFYALIVGAFLTWQSISISYSREDGWTAKSQPVPLPVLAPCLVFMAAALGISIKEELTIIAAAVSRNSAAISNLASKTSTNLSSEVIDPESNEISKE